VNIPCLLALLPVVLLTGCTILSEQKNKMIRVRSADLVKGCELKGSYKMTPDAANHLVVDGFFDNIAYRKAISAGANVVLQPEAEAGQSVTVAMYRCPCASR
jgi:hypothetical protein